MSNHNHYSRRRVVRLAAQASVGAAVGGLLTACGGQPSGPLCVNPDDLSFGENSMRKASNYVEASPHADKNCLSCAFYKPSGETAGCGDCEIFTGPANQNGYCDSWSEIVEPA